MQVSGSGAGTVQWASTLARPRWSRGIAGNLLETTGTPGIAAANGVFAAASVLGAPQVWMLQKSQWDGTRTEQRSACDKPDFTERDTPFACGLQPSITAALQMTYNQKVLRRGVREIGRRLPEDRQMLYIENDVRHLDDREQPVCQIDLKRRVPVARFLTSQGMVFTGRETTSGQFKKPYTYKWTRTLTYELKLAKCHARWTRTRFPTFKGCR